MHASHASGIAEGGRSVETFNGSLRDECLNVHWFKTLAEAKQVLEAWRRDDNESHPHRALNDMTPAEFARNIKELDPALWLLEQPKITFQMDLKRQADQTGPSYRNEWLGRTGQVMLIRAEKP